jgi:hypothetical protein
VRGARLAAVQTGLMRAAVEERFRRVLFFHSRIGEAEAMAAGGPAIATRLAEDDPDTFPPAERVWADWLYGEHPPLRRRQVLDEFASDFLGGDGFEGRDTPAALWVLSSVRDLGEGAHWRRTLRMPIRPLGCILPASNQTHRIIFLNTRKLFAPNEACASHSRSLATLSRVTPASLALL